MTIGSKGARRGKNSRLSGFFIAREARVIRGIGFLYAGNSSKNLKNFSSRVLKGIFKYIFTQILAGFYALLPPPQGLAPGPMVYIYR